MGISPLPADDPRRLIAEAVLADYRDPFRDMPPEELAKYQGRLVAMHEFTGRIIADAATLDELQKAVDQTEYANQPWSFRDAPLLPEGYFGAAKLPPLDGPPEP